MSGEIYIGGSGAAAFDLGIEIVEPMGSDGTGPWQSPPTTKAAIVQNLRSILLVEPGEWTVRPRIGSPLPQLVADPANERNLALVRTTVRASVEAYEKRYKLARNGIDAVYEERTVVENGVKVERVYLVITMRGTVLETGDALTVTIAASFGE